MDYGLSQVYGLCTLSQLGKAENVWDLRGYGL